MIYPPRAEERQVRIDFVNVESIGEAIDPLTRHDRRLTALGPRGLRRDYFKRINQAIAKDLVHSYYRMEGDRQDFSCFNAYEFRQSAAASTTRAAWHFRPIALMVQSITDVEKDVTTSLFIEGFKSIIDKYPMVSIVDIVRTSYDLFSAEDATYDILNRYPNLNAIVCTSEKDTFGAVQVIIDMNRVGKTSIIGVGVSDDILKYIELKVIAASFDMNPEIMSVKSLDIMLDENAASEYVEIPVTKVTSGNVKFFKR